MTDQEINAKIAELCGWKRDPREGYHWAWIPPGERPLTQGYYTKGIPNFCGSLDAMHEAVQQLRFPRGGTRWALNQNHLREIVSRDRGHSPESVSFEWEVANATARQRAEAFLRVHGAWKEAADA